MLLEKVKHVQFINNLNKVEKFTSLPMCILMKRVFKITHRHVLFMYPSSLGGKRFGLFFVRAGSFSLQTVPMNRTVVAFEWGIVLALLSCLHYFVICRSLGSASGLLHQNGLLLEHQSECKALLVAILCFYWDMLACYSIYNILDIYC